MILNFPYLKLNIINPPAQVVEVLTDRFGTNLLVDRFTLEKTLIKFKFEKLEHCQKWNADGYGLTSSGVFINKADLSSIFVPFDVFTKSSSCVYLDQNVAPKLIIHLIEFLVRHHTHTNDAAFIHASSINFNSHGILFAGFGGVGKTSTLVKFLSKGAQMISNDFVVLTPEKQLLMTDPKIHLVEYDYPRLFKDFDPVSKVREDLIKRLKAIQKQAVIKNYINLISPIPGMHMLSMKISAYASQLAKSTWGYFNAEDIISNSGYCYEKKLDVIFGLRRGNVHKIEIRPIETSVIARWIYTSTQIEFSNFNDYYHLIEAYPNKPDYAFSNNNSDIFSLINNCIQNVSAYMVDVPLEENGDKTFAAICNQLNISV